MSDILKIENLTVAAEETELLHGVNLAVGEGETHVLMGQNGAGKSTLGSTIMGSPEYKVTGGKIIFDGSSVEALTKAEIAEAANLKLTSLHELALRCSISDTQSFIRQFIHYERQIRQKDPA